MIPIDLEFLLLYLSYGAILLFLIIGLLYSKKKKTFTSHLIAFSIYLGILIYIFSDKDNFKEGNSIVILFLSWVFLITHLIIFIFKWFYKYLKT